MEIKFKFKTDAGDFWENGITKNGETIEEAANKIINYFNDTLRLGEKPRKLIAVEPLEEKEAKKVKVPHDWHKLTAVSNFSRGRAYDKYECSRCGAIGRRYGLEPGISIDHSSKIKSQYCKKHEN